MVRFLTSLGVKHYLRPFMLLFILASAVFLTASTTAPTPPPKPQWSVVDLNLPSDSHHAMIIFRDNNGKIIDSFTTIDVPDTAAGVKLYFRGE